MTRNQQHTIPVILQQLAQVLGASIKKHRLHIPKKFGSGYCAGYVFNEHIRMMVLNYELKKNVAINHHDSFAANRILFKFQQVIPGTDQQSAGTPSVLVATSTMDAGAVTVHSNTGAINIEIEAGYLKSLFPSSTTSPVLQSLLQNTQPLLFDQVIYPSLQKIVDEMMTEPIDEPFTLFFLKVKAEELVCRLLMELEKREEDKLYDLNGRDVQMIYQVKAKLLQCLDMPPVIKDLSVYAGMSPTKLKRLFKQVFGDPIFSYYQAFRIKEAARLLKEEKLSVSDVGYQLGFTNLSHFSRVFEEHIGQKPKQYSRS